MHSISSHREVAGKRKESGRPGLMSSLPYVARLAMISKRWKSDVLGGALRTLRDGVQPTFVRGSRRCPDGQKPHPSVCQRGWRGDVCQGCISFRY